ncbi:MAG TPA: circadian clock KaiB family protein [Gemmataceae bacterium]|jgi:circadian clock protein KaiB
MRLNGSLNQAAEFERLAIGRQHERYVLRLYVTGLTPRSTQAIVTLRAVCERHLAGRYDLEIIDLYQQPERAQGEQIVAAPTLVKELPLPVHRLIGDLSNEDRVLVGLALHKR